MLIEMIANNNKNIKHFSNTETLIAIRTEREITLLNDFYI